MPGPTVYDLMATPEKAHTSMRRSTHVATSDKLARRLVPQQAQGAT